MRPYGKIACRFWVGTTIKKLRGQQEALIVALYLMTSPHSNMHGLFYQPMSCIISETGLSEEGACKGLQTLIDLGFCSYDAPSQFVWVHEMAKYQIAEELKPSDKRVKGVQRDYNSLPDNPFLSAFYYHYKDAFLMTSCRGDNCPTEAPSMPLRSQEQQQEQEQEQEQQQEHKPHAAANAASDGLIQVQNWEPTLSDVNAELVKLKAPKTTKTMLAFVLAKYKTKYGHKYQPVAELLPSLANWVANERDTPNRTTESPKPIERPFSDYADHEIYCNGFTAARIRKHKRPEETPEECVNRMIRASLGIKPFTPEEREAFNQLKADKPSMTEQYVSAMAKSKGKSILQVIEMLSEIQQELPV